MGEGRAASRRAKPDPRVLAAFAAVAAAAEMDLAELLALRITPARVELRAVALVLLDEAAPEISLGEIGRRTGRTYQWVQKARARGRRLLAERADLRSLAEDARRVLRRCRRGGGESHRKPPPADQGAAKPRRCLAPGCGAMFPSSWPGERICPPCRQRRAARGSGLDEAALAAAP
jgi:hypothetical protein